MLNLKKIQEVADRYLNSKNEDFILDFLKLSDYLYNTHGEDYSNVEYFNIRKKLARHFIKRMLIEGKLILKEFQQTSRTRTGKQIMETWIYSRPEDRDDVMVQFDECCKKATLLELAMMLNGRDIDITKFKRVNPEEAKTVTFDIPVDNANSYVDDAIGELMKKEYGSIHELKVAYENIAIPLRNRIASDESFKDTKTKKFYYSKFTDTYKKMLVSLVVNEPDYTIDSPKYNGDWSILMGSLTSKLLKTSDWNDQLDALWYFTDAIRWKAEYHLLSGKICDSAMRMIARYMEDEVNCPQNIINGLQTVYV